MWHIDTHTHTHPSVSVECTTFTGQKRANLLLDNILVLLLFFACSVLSVPFVCHRSSLAELYARTHLAFSAQHFPLISTHIDFFLTPAFTVHTHTLSFSSSLRRNVIMCDAWLVSECSSQCMYVCNQQKQKQQQLYQCVGSKVFAKAHVKYTKRTTSNTARAS